ncbi:hypothetical protein [Variovorax sp. Root411]|uniref:hypothetical protein n=1 Tax=Variovorax sp. Root411 TaxID=1736530 RepID=UPI0012FCAA8A|nr:hypothetical protein [Variovorax sp. Root411]
MPVSVDNPLRLAQIAGVCVSATAFPIVWSVVHYPINKGTVYTGPIALFTAVSVGLWIIASLMAFGAVLWLHIKRPTTKRRGWSALLAGEAFYVLAFGCASLAVQTKLNGALKIDALSIIILAGAAVACVWGIRETLRAPKSGDGGAPGR